MSTDENGKVVLNPLAAIPAAGPMVYDAATGEHTPEQKEISLFKTNAGITAGESAAGVKKKAGGRRKLVMSAEMLAKAKASI